MCVLRRVAVRFVVVPTILCLRPFRLLIFGVLSLLHPAVGVHFSVTSFAVDVWRPVFRGLLQRTGLTGWVAVLLGPPGLRVVLEVERLVDGWVHISVVVLRAVSILCLSPPATVVWVTVRFGVCGFVPYVFKVPG